MTPSTFVYVPERVVEETMGFLWIVVDPCVVSFGIKSNQVKIAVQE